MLSFLSFISGLLPIIFFLIFKNNREKALWVVYIYILTSFLIDNFLYFFDNAILLNKKFYLLSSFTIIEYALFSFFLYLQYKSEVFKKLVIIASFLFLSFAIFLIVHTTDYKFDSWSTSIECILLISYCLLFFFEQLKSLEDTYIYNTKKFWISTAILIYCSATFILFTSTKHMSAEESNAYWPINLIANIIKNILLTIAFVLKNEKKNTDFFIKSEI